MASTLASVVKSISGIGAATIAGQAFFFAVSPLVARLYDPAAFGAFGLFVSWSAILSVVATLRLHDAIIAPARERVSAILFLESSSASIVISIIIALAFTALINFGALGLGVFPIWVGASIYGNIAIIGLMMSMQSWLVRERDWNLLAGLSLTQWIVRGLAQLSLGFLGAGFGGLIAAEILTRSIPVSCAIARRWARLRLLVEGLRINEAVAVVREYRHFIWSRTPSAILDNVGTTLMTFMVAARFGLHAAGLYTFMESVLNTPLAFLNRAVGDVFLGHFAAASRENPSSARRLFWSTAMLLGGFAVILLAAIVVMSPLFALVFGEQWRKAGELGAIMAPAIAARLVVSPLSGVINVVNRPELKLGFDVIQVGSIFAAFAFGKAYGLALEQTIGLAAWLLVFSYTIFFGLLLWGIYAPRVEVLTYDHPARSE